MSWGGQISAWFIANRLFGRLTRAKDLKRDVSYPYSWFFARLVCNYHGAHALVSLAAAHSVFISFRNLVM